MIRALWEKPLSQLRRKPLRSPGLKVDDIDIWEINEAFAIVTSYDMSRIGIPREDWDKKVNTRGGAVAIGHPLGATGVRLIGTCARILNIEKARYGLATMCGGGGQATATVLERKG